MFRIHHTQISVAFTEFKIAITKWTHFVSLNKHGNIRFGLIRKLGNS